MIEGDVGENEENKEIQGFSSLKESEMMSFIKAAIMRDRSMKKEERKSE